MLRSSMPEAVLAAHEPHVVRLVAAGLGALAYPYRVVRPCAAEVLGTPRGAVYCLGSRLVSELPELPGPTIVVLCGARLVDEALARLQAAHFSTIQVDGITPVALLQAVVSASSGSEVHLVGELAGMEGLDRVPRPLIGAFLEHPSRMTRLTDLRRALAPLSREGAQALVHSAGFERAEHLFTALRCATWALLHRHGLNRKEVEHYLGICDRTSFRRACHRAGVPTLRGDLRPETFRA